MSRPAAPAAAADQLRFLTCGSVDDGKSTLLGRLLYECGAIYDDQHAALAIVSRRLGTQGEAIDYALLLDGLEAEREQGITIDVAYRFFSSPNRQFIAADAPGHEQYTRNMITAASTADLAIILVDARKGLLTQTRRHSFLVSLMGVRHVILAVNKMDLVDWAQARFDAIVADYSAFARDLGFQTVSAVPVSGLHGDNITTASTRMPWRKGPTLLQTLEQTPLNTETLAAAPFRMPVQWVNRPTPDVRGYCGLISAGAVSPGDAVQILPAKTTTHIASIETFDGALPTAVAGQSVMLTFTDTVDCGRGDVVALAARAPDVADQFEAILISMTDAPLLPGRTFVLKLAARSAIAQIGAIKHKFDINSFAALAAKELALNDIALCTINLDHAVPFEPYLTNRDLGGFILIDRESKNTVAAGLIRNAVRHAADVQWQALTVTRQSHAALKGQSACIVWFTGLSGAGKSTIANLVEKKLHAMRRHTILLDGDNVRHGLNRDLGFTDADRVENIRRIAEVARLMSDAGLIVLVAFISPFRADRVMARDIAAAGEFCEVFVDAPLAIAESRDPKGLYAKARRGQITNFTGIDSPYEAPLKPEIHVDTTRMTAEDAADLIIRHLSVHGRLRPPDA